MPAGKNGEKKVNKNDTPEQQPVEQSMPVQSAAINDVISETLLSKMDNLSTDFKTMSNSMFEIKEDIKQLKKIFIIKLMMSQLLLILDLKMLS